jgi:hypothetical protein
VTLEVIAGKWMGVILVDYYLRIVILMVELIELGNPAGGGLTLSRKSYLLGNTPNMHCTTRHNYSLMRKKYIHYSSPVYTLGTLNKPNRRSDEALCCDLINY